MPGEAGDVGFKQAMQQRWLALDKSAGEPRVVRKADSITDRTQQLLQDLADGKEVRSAGLACWGWGQLVCSSCLLGQRGVQIGAAGAVGRAAGCWCCDC